MLMQYLGGGIGHKGTRDIVRIEEVVRSLGVTLARLADEVNAMQDPASAEANDPFTADIQDNLAEVSQPNHDTEFDSDEELDYGYEYSSESGESDEGEDEGGSEEEFPQAPGSGGNVYDEAEYSGGDSDLE